MLTKEDDVIMPVYNKLVRDKIPEIIEGEGQIAKTTVLDHKELYKALVEKLYEEVNEFSENDSIEELVDILEVIDAIIIAKGATKEQVRLIQEDKRAKRGEIGRAHV